MKRLPICMGLLIFVLVLTPSVSRSDTAAETKGKPVTVLLDWFVNPDHVPLYVALEKGFFKKRGLDVTFIAPSNPNDPPKLVAAGKADLAVSYQHQHHPTWRFPISISTTSRWPRDCRLSEWRPWWPRP